MYFWDNYSNIYARKKIKTIRIVLGILIPITYIMIHIPPGVTVEQNISAVVIFLVVIYSAIRTLKYYKII